MSLGNLGKIELSRSEVYVYLFICRNDNVRARMVGITKVEVRLNFGARASIILLDVVESARGGSPCLMECSWSGPHVVFGVVLKFS